MGEGDMGWAVEEGGEEGSSTAECRDGRGGVRTRGEGLDGMGTGMRSDLESTVDQRATGCLLTL